MSDPSTPLSATASAPLARHARGHAPLAAVMRGDAVDSLHMGSVAVVDRDGRLLYAAGDPGFLTMTRSALKPFQAMPFVAADGIRRFAFHHRAGRAALRKPFGRAAPCRGRGEMLAKAGNAVDDLQCGTHVRRASTSSAAKSPPPPPYSPLANNCSGKHSGMLAYCVLNAACRRRATSTYDHPLQQAIRRAVAHFTSTPEAELVAGIDGCSAPNYAVPLDRPCAWLRPACGAAR